LIGCVVGPLHISPSGASRIGRNRDERPRRWSVRWLVLCFLVAVPDQI
jgi:hypothetical protein